MNLLYHGTTEAVARKVLADGLKPRSMHHGRANWMHVFAGCRHVVYLTDAYPITYAVEAVNQRPDQRLAIIELDLDRIDPANLVPDEDMLAQALRGKDNLSPAWDIKRRCIYYKHRLREYADLWETSLRLMGTCGYYGSVVAAAVRRVALIDYKIATAPVWMAMNASISLGNYRFVGAQHKTLTRWFFDDPSPVLDDLQKFMVQGQIDHLKTMKRAGIEIVDNPRFASLSNR